MDLDVHVRLTRTAHDDLGGFLAEEQLGIVLLANVLQDLYQTESRMHFDNCAFSAGVDYIDDEWSLIEASAERAEPVALGACGRLLHAVQDFYSHSNWVELHLDRDPIPVWDLAGSSLSSDVVSGTWVLGRPKVCRSGTPSHSELNKDDAHSGSGREVVSAGPHQGKTLFDLASDVAVRASVQQFRRLRDIKDDFLIGEAIGQQLSAHEVTAEALVGLAEESSRFKRSLP
jgi:hypothetical protein